VRSPNASLRNSTETQESELTQAFSETLAIRGAYCDTGNVDFEFPVGDPKPAMPDTLYLLLLLLVTACSGGLAGKVFESFNCRFSAGSDW
jgi:hypothetical protein